MAGDLVLLTGATGMIGFKTLVDLLQAGYNVRAAVRNQAGFERVARLKPVATYTAQLTSIIVPDMTIPGAYDEAVKGVKYVIHVASPLVTNTPKGVDYESYMIQPAIRGTIGILESANKIPDIEKVVITASVVSITTLAAAAKVEIVDEQFRATDTNGPFDLSFRAYEASKALSYQATEKFIADCKPSFSVINILPVFVIGRDDTVTDIKDITRGTNGMVMGPLLGQAIDDPMTGFMVHLDDVARMHVMALGPAVRGNQDFLAAFHTIEELHWHDSFEIVKRRFPKQYAEGVFKFDSIKPPVTTLVKVDSTKAERAFGFNFKSYEEQVVSVVEHYLELVDQK